MWKKLLQSRSKFTGSIRFLSLLTAVLLLFSACSNSAEAEDPVDPYCEFTDSLGETVVLKEKPKKVAVLFSSYAQVWSLCGGSVDITVGESVERGFADGSAVLVDSGAGHSSIDLEALAAAGPELVIGTADYNCQLDAVKFCRENGIPAAAFRVESEDDYLKLLEVFCSMLDAPEVFNEYGARVKAETQDIIERSAMQEHRGMPYLFIRAGSSARSVKVKTASDNFVCAMIDELGGRNIADASPVLSDSLSMEYIISRDPEYIFVSSMGDENASKDYVASMLQQPEWQALSAVKNGRVYYLDKELYHFKPNQRWAESYSGLYKILYGEE